MTRNGTHIVLCIFKSFSTEYSLNVLWKLYIYLKEFIRIIQIKLNDLLVLKNVSSDLPKYNLKINLTDIVLEMKTLYALMMKIYI